MHCYYLERYLPSNNIRYIAVGDGIDTATSAGLNFLIFKLSFNDYYSQDISNKIKAVKKRKQEKGEYQATYPPFGYKKDPNNKNHLIIDETSKVVVKSEGTDNLLQRLAISKGGSLTAMNSDLEVGTFLPT